MGNDSRLPAVRCRTCGFVAEGPNQTDNMLAYTGHVCPGTGKPARKGKQQRSTLELFIRYLFSEDGWFVLLILAGALITIIALIFDPAALK